MVDVGQWSVFRRGHTGGNPCPVIAEAQSLTSGQMQAIAAHYGHESAFITRVAPSRVSLRFFVPRHEMRMCVHATIAAITALAGSGSIAGGEADAVTASGEHRVSWAGDEQPDVTVEQSAPAFGPPAAVHAEVTLALRLPRESIARLAPIRPVSVSRAKLIVPLRHADEVQRARPDFAVLWELCRRLDTTGAYVFAPHPDGDPQHVVARQFPVDAGFPEDPATGVAAAALAAYLAAKRRQARPTWIPITIDQGDAMGQPSWVRAAALAGPDGITRTSVTGRAVRTGQVQLSLRAIAGERDLPEPELR